MIRRGLAVRGRDRTADRVGKIATRPRSRGNTGEAILPTLL